MTKTNIWVIIAVIVVILFMISEPTKKEAVIPDYVEPDSSVSVMGELRVKDDATAFTPGEPFKVHWNICTDEGCTDIVSSGYESLTSTEIQDLIIRLTSPFKSVIYYMDFTAPSIAGTYYYEGTAETEEGLRVLEIDLDSNINFVHSNEFIVAEITDDPCMDYTDEEIVDIPNGVIRITIMNNMTGTEPYCVEVSQEDIGFEVICNAGYLAVENGRDSSCETCNDTEWLPLVADVCDETTFTQTSNCGNERGAIGTQDCNGNGNGADCSNPCPSPSNYPCGQYINSISGCAGTCPDGTSCPTGSLCDTTKGECIEGKCYSDAHCDTSNCEVCIEGMCTSECKIYQTCKEGECKLSSLVWIAGLAILAIIVIKTFGKKT